MTSEILVYLILTKSRSVQSEAIARLFQDGKFSVIKIRHEGESDDTSIIRCLQASRKRNELAYTIVIKGNSIANCDPDTCSRVILDIIQSGNFDLFYLCRWADNNIPFGDGSSPQERTIAINSTDSGSLQATIFSPNGRDITLGRMKMPDSRRFAFIDTHLADCLTAEVVAGNMVALCVNPSLIELDPTLPGGKITDYIANTPRELKDEASDIRDGQVIRSVSMLALVIAVVTLLAWMGSRR